MVSPTPTTEINRLFTDLALHILKTKRMLEDGQPAKELLKSLRRADDTLHIVKKRTQEVAEAETEVAERAERRKKYLSITVATRPLSYYDKLIPKVHLPSRKTGEE